MALLERHLQLLPPFKVSGWRNLAIGTWRTAKDPSVYGMLDLDVRPVRRYLDAEISRLADAGRPVKLTVTHMLGKVVAEAFRRHPEINVVLRFGRLYRRRHVTLFFQAASDAAGQDLSGVSVREAETKSLEELAAEMNRRVAAVKDGSDRSYRQMKTLMGLLPGWLTGWVLDAASFLQYTLNLWSPLLGTPKDPLGSVMITNVGTLGLDFAFAPLVPYSRVPMVIAAGAIRDQVIAVDGKPEVAPMLRLGVTFDHRLIDGVHAAKLAAVVQELFAHPERLA